MFSEEVQLVGKVGNVDLQLGGFYSHETGSETSKSISIGAQTGNRVGVTDAGVTSKSLAFFGQASWKLTDRLSLTGGARWTRDIKAVQNRNGVQSSAGVFTCGIPLELRNDPAVCAANLSDAFAKPSWLSSLDYRFSPQFLVYAKVARGFRAGGQNQRAVNSVPTFVPFRPETVTEYEAGIKADLFDRRLRINLAAFHDDYSDVQRTIVVLVGASTASVTSNAAKAKLNGFEAEVTAKPTTRLTLSGTLGLLDPKYGQFIDFTGDRSNEEWPAPKINYSLGARYVLPASFGDVSANVDWRWTGRQNLVPSGVLRSQLTQPAFGLLNARLSATIKSADTDIVLFGTNLLDQNYYTAGIAFEALGFNQLYTGDPRVIGVQVTKRFGVF
jgi:iron complex outermembrane receptor protein